MSSGNKNTNEIKPGKIIEQIKRKNAQIKREVGIRKNELYGKNVPTHIKRITKIIK